MTNTVSRGKKNFMKKYRKIVFRVILFEDEGFIDFSDKQCHFTSHYKCLWKTENF